MLGGGSFCNWVNALFKRRKPDEPLPATSDVVQPAGTTPPTDQSKADDSDAELRHAASDLAQPSSDTGLGVPPFRPAPSKDAHIMSRPPFSSSGTTPSAPVSPARPSLTTSRPAARDPAERRTLVVGRGISVQGVVQDAERLVVEGTVEATMIHATELAIAPGGVFKGEIEVEDAEIAGTIDGTLTVRGSLVLRGSGRVLGTARCRRLQVEDGGQITGRIEMITEQPQTDTPHPPRQNAEPVA
jgi:cytoskeletal protein CcmA (bactofilin family)